MFKNINKLKHKTIGSKQLGKIISRNVHSSKIDLKKWDSIGFTGVHSGSKSLQSSSYQDFEPWKSLRWQFTIALNIVYFYSVHSVKVLWVFKRYLMHIMTQRTIVLFIWIHVLAAISHAVYRSKHNLFSIRTFTVSMVRKLLLHYLLIE